MTPSVLFLRPVQIDLGEWQAQFEELSRRHTPKHGFRTYDLIHVASALILNCDEFWSFDPNYAQAQFAGIAVLPTVS